MQDAWSAAAGRGGGARAVWGLGEAHTEPRQVLVDAEIGQKRLRCRSEKRSRETPVTLSGEPQQPLGGARWLDWPAGTSRGRHAASRLKVVMKYP